MQVGILGAGLSGLTLGYLLNQRKILFEVLEKENNCGGLMRTLCAEGFSFDYGGSHIIFSQDNAELNFMLDLLKTNKIKNKRNAKILYNDYYVAYPFENGLSDLPKADNFECLSFFVQNLLKKAEGNVKKPSNLYEWCYHTFGKGIAEKYLLPYNEKIWKYPLEQIGLDWVERIPNPPLEDILKASLGLHTEGYTQQLYFYYPEVGGINALIQSILDELPGKVFTGFEIKSIKKDGKKWIISDGKTKKSFDKIISTIPIHELIRALDAPSEIKNAVDNLEYNSLICVMIGLNTPKLNDLTWLYIPQKEVLTHRVSFPANYGPKVVPVGKSSILAEIACAKNSKTWNLDDEEIKEIVINELHRLKILNKDDVCYSGVQRTDYAYVINDLNYNQYLRIIKNYVDELGIGLVGRFAEFKYLNMDACVKNAMNYLEENKFFF